MSAAPGRPRVLLLAAANDTSGGGERHVADLVRLLPEAGVDVALACPAGGDLGDLARDLRVAVCEVAIATGSSPAGLAAVRRAVRASAPDVVHAHGSRAAAYARAADRRARRRVVYTLHGIHTDRAGSAARRTAFLSVERALRPLTARFVTVCDADAARGAALGVLDPARTSTVHNGVEVPAAAAPSGRFRREAGAGDGVPLVLSVGRFHEQKDQETLLRAWGAVTSARPGAVLALVGSGPLEADLRELARAAGVAGEVRFLPPRRSLDAAYADADLFVLSSRWEGLPYVVLEAMARGLPVVSTSVDGVPEAVTDGSTGLLVPPGDPAALTAAVCRLLSDPALRIRFGAAGRARIARDFSLAGMIERLAAVYRGVAG